MTNTSQKIHTLKRYQPTCIRLWHWLNALIVFGLLATVVLRKTFLSWRTNSVLIEEKIKATGATIDVELTKQIAKSIRDVMWEWHIRLGIALALLLIFRIVIRFVAKRCPSLEALAAWKASARHVAAVRLSYFGYLLIALFMSVTGLLMHFKNELTISKDLIETLKESHEFTMWLVVIFVVMHIIGVIFGELTHYRGIVSYMINGGDREENSKP